MGARQISSLVRWSALLVHGIMRVVATEGFEAFVGHSSSAAELSIAYAGVIDDANDPLEFHPAQPFAWISVPSRMAVQPNSLFSVRLRLRAGGCAHAIWSRLVVCHLCGPAGEERTALVAAPPAEHTVRAVTVVGKADVSYGAPFHVVIDNATARRDLIRRIQVLNRTSAVLDGSLHAADARHDDDEVVARARQLRQWIGATRTGNCAAARSQMRSCGGDAELLSLIRPADTTVRASNVNIEFAVDAGDDGGGHTLAALYGWASNIYISAYIDRYIDT